MVTQQQANPNRLDSIPVGIQPAPPWIDTLPYDPAIALRRIAQHLAGLGFPIQAAMLDAGLLSTGPLEMFYNTQLLEHRRGWWVDCGTDLFLSRAYTADKLFVRLTIAMRPVADSVTEVSVKMFSGSEEQQIWFNAQTGCRSRHRLEPLLFAAWKAP